MNTLIGWIIIAIVLGAVFNFAVDAIRWLSKRLQGTRGQSKVSQPAPTTQSAFDASVQKARERPGLFYTITSAWIIAMIAASVFATFNWQNEALFITGILSLPLGQLIVALQIFWLAASIRIIGVSEVAAVVLYDLPMIRVRRGPKLIIFGLFQLYRFKASVHQNQFPGEPELIQKGDDKIPLEIVEFTQPDGTIIHQQKVRPIRVTTAKPKKRLGEDDILNVQMTVEFTFWVRWIATDPFELIINVGGDLNEVVRQMRDAGESLLNNEVTQLTPSELIAGFRKLRNKLLDAIKEAVQTWGVEVITVGLTSPDLSHELATALRNIPVAKADATTKVINAHAERIRLDEEGKGRGQAREGEIAGEGRGYKRAGHFIGVPPQVVLEAQVARETIGEGDLIIGTDGLTQAIGLGGHLLNRNRSASDNQRNQEQGGEQE